MRLSYPATLKNYPNGQVGVTFVDVPEAMTAGAGVAEALRHAEDALVVVMAAYVDERRPISAPSAPQAGQPLVDLPPLVAMKLAVYQEMLVRNMTQQQLAELIGCDARQVRRILDLEHESKVSQVEAALAALGLRVAIEVEAVDHAKPYSEANDLVAGYREMVAEAVHEKNSLSWPSALIKGSTDEKS